MKNFRQTPQEISTCKNSMYIENNKKLVEIALKTNETNIEGLIPSNFVETTTSHKAAGILPVAFAKGTVLFLLGAEKRKETHFSYVWADMGGCIEEKENSLTTATREFWEETGGLLYPDIPTTQKWVENNLLYSHFFRQGKYMLYMVETSYDPNLPMWYEKQSKNDENAEMKKLMWISIDALFELSFGREYIITDGRLKPKPFWRKFLAGRVYSCCRELFRQPLFIQCLIGGEDELEEEEPNIYNQLDCLIEKIKSSKISQV